MTSLLNEHGSIIEKYSYDAFGTPKVTDPSGNDRQIGGRYASWYANRFLFQGREFIHELGIYDYRHRFYHPAIGRFLQTDPTGLHTEGAKLTPEQRALFSPGGVAPEAFSSSELNLYRYCGDNPVNHSDPTGLAIDTIADIGFIGYDIYKLVTEGGGQGGENRKALGLDSVAALVPFATGAGAGYRGAKAVERASEAARAAEKSREPAQLARGKLAHKNEPILPGEKAEVRTPSGKRMDRYNEETGQIREIKPNNPRAIKQGKRQVEGYRREMQDATNKPHPPGEVAPYDPKKYGN